MALYISVKRSSPAGRTVQEAGDRPIATGHVHHLRRLAHRARIDHPKFASDLFVTRNVGNVVPPYGQMNGGVSTALEYAVVALGVQHIIVCGHSDCGAMRAVLNPDSPTRCLP